MEVLEVQHQQFTHPQHVRSELFISASSFFTQKQKNDKRPLTPRTPPRSRTPVEASVLNVGGSSTSSTSSASGGGGELLSGRGRTDVVRRRISQQHAKLCGVLQINGRLRVFHSAGKEECFVPVQSVMSTFCFF